MVKSDKKNDKRSLVMILISMVIWGSVGIFRRFIPVSSAVLACFRGIIGTAFLVVFVKVQGKRLFYPLGKGVFFLLFLSGALMGFNWILLFEAYSYTSVSTATLCYYMAPTIVILLSPVIFREKITIRKGICALTAVFGMILVSGVVENGLPALSEIKGVLFGLGAAVLYASVVIINKKLPGIDPFEKTVIQLGASALVLIPYLVLTGETLPTALSLSAVILLLIVGLVHTGIAYALYFGSVDGLQAQTVAILSYLDPITALVLSAIVLHEKMTVYGIIGAVLIIGAAVIGEKSES